ncbi:MAG: translation elongation factor EF-1 subunit alpha [Candidatus Thermoplasmatota archaeon]|nr:translation elongation factor EF-1 subunit alpha [Candidatus Thermoplasmatota archaeon]
MANKPHLNIVFIGHVDHGKSTLVGRMLFNTKNVDQYLIEKYKKEAEEKGKATFEFAWVMDNLKEERERGVTIDVSHRRFDTPKYYFTIIDAPGHRDFVKNMITGTSQADAAVLVVDAGKGPEAQTKEHVFLARTLGVTQLIVAVNKMDSTQPPYSQEAFEKTKKAVTDLLKSVRYKVDEIPFIPVSAYVGDNTTEPSGNLSWWKGDTLLSSLDKLKEPPKVTEKPLRLPVQDVYTITGIGTVPVGRVETGILKKDMRIIFMPSNKTGEVKSIEMHHEQMEAAYPGDNVGFNVRGIAKTDIKRGDVAGPMESVPTVAKSFVGQIAILNHPSLITVGYTPVFHCHTSQVACTFTELQKKIDPATGGVKEEKPQFLKTGDVAFVKIEPTKPMVIEKASDFPQLGRFAIRDMGQTVAAGVCTEVEKRTT